jgi:hypothetical protein
VRPFCGDAEEEAAMPAASGVESQESIIRLDENCIAGYSGQVWLDRFASNALAPGIMSPGGAWNGMPFFQTTGTERIGWSCWARQWNSGEWWCMAMRRWATISPFAGNPGGKSLAPDALAQYWIGCPKEP